MNLADSLNFLVTKNTIIENDLEMLKDSETIQEYVV